MSINENGLNNVSRVAQGQLYTSMYERLTFIGFCHLLYAGFNWVFDYVLYVYAVYNLGAVIGGSVMTVLALVQCALTLLIYERMRIDWVGAGAIHEWQDQHCKTFAGQIFRRIKDNPRAVFIFLCIFADPFIITAYFRKGRFNGLRAKDWYLFFGSGIISNAYWICVSVMLGSGAVSLWHWLSMHVNTSNAWIYSYSATMTDHYRTLWEWMVMQSH